MFPGLDPSKLDPKVIAQLTELIRQLPYEQIQRMQTLMHNAMAGFNVQKDMEEFERSLPPGFREKVAALMLTQGLNSVASARSPEPSSAAAVEETLSVSTARITVLRAVANQEVTPEEAEKILFTST